MSVRELREIFFKSRRWQPVVAAIINYLSNVDYRLASISHKVNEINVDKITEIEQEFDSMIDDVENVSERVSALEFRMEDVEEDIAGVHLEWIASDHEAIEDLQERIAAAEDSIADLKDDVEDLQTAIDGLDPSAIANFERQMQGAYVRFSGASDSTPTTSPYRKILNIDANSSKIYDNDIKIVKDIDADRLEFLVVGRVELTFSCKFTGSAAGQHIAIGSSNVPSTGATQIALSKGTWEEPLLNAIFEVSANACVYMFAGAASNSARTYTPNSPMTYVHARYIEKY